MINQLPIYIGCYLLGWFPLYSMYRWIEDKVSFGLDPKKGVFSWMFFYQLMYWGLEILRGYVIMLIAHDFLLFDNDLLIAVGLFLIGLFWPFFFKLPRLSIWLCIMGMFMYLFSFIWIGVPIILFGLMLVGMSYFNSYMLMLSIYFFIELWVQISVGFNSLYLLFYGLFLGFVGIKLYSSRSLYLKDLI